MSSRYDLVSCTSLYTALIRPLFHNGVAVVIAGSYDPSRCSGDSNHDLHRRRYSLKDLQPEMRSLQPRQLTRLIVGVAMIVLHPLLALGEDSTARSFLDEGHPTLHERSIDPDRQHPAGDNHHELLYP